MLQQSHRSIRQKVSSVTTLGLLGILALQMTAAHAATPLIQKEGSFIQGVVSTLQLKKNVFATAVATTTVAEPDLITPAVETAPSGLRKLPERFVSSGSRDAAIYINSLTPEEQARVRMLDITTKSVVSVVSTDPKNNLDEYLSRLSGVYQDYTPVGPRLAFSISQGSGFFVNSTGLLATSKHVVANANNVYRIVTSDNTVYEVERIIRDPLLDLAFVQIKNPSRDIIQPVNFVDKSIAPLIGQTVFSIGNTLGKYPNTVSQGIISEVNRTVTAYGEANSIVDLFDMIQTDAAISQGNSGGPLLDSNGRVLGLNTAFDQDGENIGFSIPSSYIQAAIDSFKKNGQIIKPLVGIQYIMLDGYMTRTYNIPVNNGAYVLQDDGNVPGVLRGSPAEVAGIQPGDIITKVNDIKLTQSMTLMNAITKLRGEERVTLTIFRAGKEFTVVIPITSAN